MKLNELIPNKGAKRSRKRLGTGISAGGGKTAGRGTKGEGARSGQGGHLYRQGGNLPFYRRLPFIRGEGFTPPFRTEYNEVNLSQLDVFGANDAVTPETLSEAKLLKKGFKPIVLLGLGEVNVPLKVRVHRISSSAKAKIEAAGGSVEIIE